MVRAELAEHLMTAGDVGRPPSALMEAFPELHGNVFAGLPPVWWHSAADAPSCCASARLGTGEPKRDFVKRVAAFRKWLFSRPETEMVVFGHSTFFKYFQGIADDRRLKNGELLTLTF